MDDKLATLEERAERFNTVLSRRWRHASATVHVTSTGLQVELFRTNEPARLKIGMAGPEWLRGKPRLQDVDLRVAVRTDWPLVSQVERVQPMFEIRDCGSDFFAVGPSLDFKE